MAPVNTQLAYILHKRAYRESSQILEVFSRDYGRLSLMSRGSRGPKSKIAGNLQLFSPLLLSWQGKGSLPNLRNVERADVKPPQLSRRSLLSAMYINELLMYLLHRDDVHEGVFEHYHHCLYALENERDIEIELRRFEIKLLELIGFALLFTKDADSGQPVRAEAFYQYHVEHGPVQCEAGNGRQNGAAPVLQGQTLLALGQQNYPQIQQSRQQMQQLKRLMRQVIAFHLGGRKLKSRELFQLPGQAPSVSR
ncbi:MAG TPA: DNA repair protein RecO [Thiotrichales bacterium]|nr:DNA repair protein RecO [Thiotrichales bacterium]